MQLQLKMCGSYRIVPLSLRTPSPCRIYNMALAHFPHPVTRCSVLILLHQKWSVWMWIRVHSGVALGCNLLTVFSVNPMPRALRIRVIRFNLILKAPKHYSSRIQFKFNLLGMERLPNDKLSCPLYSAVHVHNVVTVTQHGGAIVLLVNKSSRHDEPYPLRGHTVKSILSPIPSSKNTNQHIQLVPDRRVRTESFSCRVPKYFFFFDAYKTSSTCQDFRRYKLTPLPPLFNCDRLNIRMDMWGI